MLDADEVFVNLNIIKKNFPQKAKIKKDDFDLKYFPITNINKVVINLDSQSKIEGENIHTLNVNNRIETSLYAKIKTPYTKSPIIVGENGKIIYDKNIFLENLSLRLDNLKFYISGDNDKFFFNASSLSTQELKTNFLYFYKYKHPNKKNFIENFNNFKGTIDVSLEYSKSGFNGECVAHNLSADFWTRKIAVNLPKVIFYFKNREIKANAKGTFGYEPVTTDFYLSGLATKKLHIEGNVYSLFTDKIVKKYFPEMSIKGKVIPKVKYLVNNEAVDVFYTLKVPINNNILSDYGNLENIHTNRLITAHTYKNGDDITLKSVDYSIDDKKMLYGDGLFEKENLKYKPSYIVLKTNGNISTDVIKSFLKNYIKNGMLNANLKYDFKNKNVLGFVNLYDISHSNFLFLKNTSIKIKENIITMITYGTFFNSPIKANLKADNSLKSGLIIHNIDIYLKKFTLKKVLITEQHEKLSQKHYKATDFNIEIKKGQLVVDEINHKQFDVKNLKIYGNLKNNIVNFIMPKADYSNGIISAKGTYDVKKHDSNIYAFASDIDSNLAATKFFKLKDQIEGIAFATAHLITKNRLNYTKADINFAVDDGFLPKLGSREFIISKSKKNNKKKDFIFTLEKISNIDFSKPNIFYSNLYGGLTIENNFVKRAKIFSKSDYLSMFIEGNYNIDTERGDLDLWGKHNKTAAKKIRILKIPINWIYKFVFKPEHTYTQHQDKIEQIPDIKADKNDVISTFRVHVCGELNSDNKIHVELKDLR